MLTCSNFFIILFIISIIFFISTSRKSNLCFLISSSISLVCTIVFYLVINGFFQDAALEFSIFLQTFEGLSIPDLNRERMSLSYGILMVIFYVVSFIICSIIFHELIEIDNPLLPRSKDYMVSNIIMIVINVLIFSFIILFAITYINVLYSMQFGFLCFIFELFEEGIFLL